MQTTLLIKRRVTVLLLLVIAAVFFLVARLLWVQFVWGENLQKLGLDARMGEIPVEAPRGNIYDRSGHMLVDSISVDSIYAVPAQIKHPSATAKSLAGILDMDRNRILKLITQKVAFVWLKRKADEKTVGELKKLKLAGIGFVAESKREYPHGDLAAHVLGFVGVDNQGLTGIEKAYDRQLMGKNGRILIEYDAQGRKIPLARQEYVPPQQGDSLYLTIDENIQSFVERELDKVAAVYKPKTAVIIVMNPKTGGILAMGSRPTYDPANWQDSQRSVWDRNPAIWYNYEPGSTFKIVTLTAALQEGVVNRQWQFFDPGYIKVADRNIHCWYDGGHGSENLEQVVQNSCNPGFVEMGLKLGVDRFYKFISNFGFGTPTGIDLPGEAAGIVIPQKKATNLNLATMALGQSIAVTPIQLISALSAIANGGILVKPHLVKEVVAPGGQVVWSYTPGPDQRIISPQVASEVGTLLNNVVVKGTGKNAYVDGYPVAGKTGTAQVVGQGGGYVSGKYVASFVGFAPVQNPQIAVLIMIAEPQGGQYYGGVVASPVFKEVVGDTLHYLHVPEVKGMPKPVLPFVTPQQVEPVEVPGVVNYPLDAAISALEKAGLRYTVSGSGQIVYRQVPAGGAIVNSGTAVLLDLNPGPVTGAEVTVPSLAGLTVEDAAVVLERLGLHLDPVGIGLAQSQDPPPGRKLSPGSTVRVYFKIPPEK